MNEKEQIIIFHIYRKDGTALFLHPFDSLAKLGSVLRKNEIGGKYGHEPRVESLTLFRNDLYRMIEGAVKNWVMEIRFIPRFVMSAAVFLIAYIFFSFVIPDPIPVIDETLLGFGLALVAYFFLARRDQRSNLALRSRVELRAAVDRIVFKESSFVREVEEALQRNESDGRDKVLKQMLSNPSGRFDVDDEDDLRQMLFYLEKRFNTKEYKKQEKLISRVKDVSTNESKVEILSKWSESKKIDLSLFDIYRRVKRSYKQVK